ncbi:hypothetical protein NQ318_021062 [Aromia moschata]|uniref:Uncharacterized protein n=1 Tax=Aromia moschata TaxID=1265417 RepID=A0AAV8YAE7_9CUCU|nr:hypothetical protein NQ318_021062 [Aromia moschata]
MASTITRHQQMFPYMPLLCVGVASDPFSTGHYRVTGDENELLTYNLRLYGAQLYLLKGVAIRNDSAPAI